ncbi:MAG: hypothetical protein QY326_08550 [Bdellovibrionota bacterium]|nr:MAG: hypothetical protein QY326_08550 [Bdellovibrionota bacterium]
MSANPVQRQQVVLGSGDTQRSPRPLHGRSSRAAASILVLPRQLSRAPLQDTLANIHDLDTKSGNVVIDASQLRTIPAELFGAICAAAHSAKKNGNHVQLLVHPSSTIALLPHNGILVQGVVADTHPIDLRVKRQAARGGSQQEISRLEGRLQELGRSW